MAIQAAQGGDERPTLLCEYTENPVGIDAEHPRFSWRIAGKERGEYQSAYRILVASAQDLLLQEQGDMWDSGKVASHRSVNVPYAGKPLQSMQRYFWRVKTWDENGAEQDWLDVAFFEMGLLSPEDWTASWISGGKLLRKEVRFNQPVLEARAYVCGLGYYELHINGDKIGDHVLDPGWTDYDKRVLYNVYDVSFDVIEGNNAIGLMLGNGRYSPAKEKAEKSPIPLKTYGDAPVAKAQIWVRLADDTEHWIATDASWQAAPGPVVEDDIWNGETYDARMEMSGWDCPDCTTQGWRSAQVVDGPSGALVSQAAFTPIRVVKTVQPRSVSNPKPGVYVFDFEQNLTGWARLRVHGPSGTEVRLRFAELLDEEGMLNTIPNRGAQQTDVYILAGEGEEDYEPRFTYHGFRYVEVTGFPGTPGIEDIEAKVVHSDVEPVGAFSCSNELLNEIHRNILWGQVSNLMSVPTDCPQRDERMGWTGDAQLAAEGAVLNFNMAGFYTKYLDDMKDAQKEDGSIPDVIPAYWSLYPADPAWGTACVEVPWQLYQFYEDRQVLEDNYDLMKRWVEFLRSQADGDLVVYGKYGDWCPPGHVRSPETTVGFTSSWYYYHDVYLLARIAEILGRSDDAKEYAALAERVKDAFNREYLATGRYSGTKLETVVKQAESMISPSTPKEQRERMLENVVPLFVPTSQTCQALPLALDMVPDDAQAAVVKALVNDVVVAKAYHPNTGILGTKYLFQALTKTGHVDVAYKVAAQDTFPSWGYMIREGATTIWERWEYLDNGGMNSHNHIMLGTVDTFFYKMLAGISVEPGGDTGDEMLRVTIHPRTVDDLRHASGSVRTLRGLVSSSWSRVDSSLLLSVRIPWNATGEIHVPKLGFNEVEILEGSELVWHEGAYKSGVPGIAAGREEDGTVAFEVGSGLYSFTVQPVPGT
jgi:alpha-L-rhamnosidase